jgi:signal peptidase II
MIWVEPVLAAAAVLIADQISKALVVSRTTSHKSVQERPFVSIQQVVNRRGVLASFGGRTTVLGIWAIAMASSALVLQCGILGPSTLGSIGMGAAVGGATGNLLDQLRRGAIIDFIAIKMWPAFNLADVAIILGAALTMLSIR